MRVPNDSDFLGIWESGSRRHPLDRALIVLGAAFPELPAESLAGWPLGRRNRELVELHGRCFGPRLSGVVSCAGCGEKLEVDLDGPTRAGEADGPGPLAATGDVGGDAYRLPASRDLARVAAVADPRAAAALLAEGCRVGGGAREALSDAELEEIGERMAAADPLAEIRVRLRCPECGRDAEETLDIAAFVWAEVEARVRALLSEIHALACAYGWSEADILAMSARRRALYLEMLAP